MPPLTIPTTDDRAVDTICGTLADGGVVVFPSANTYGLLANGDSEEAVREIYRLKGRDAGKPLGFLTSPARAGEVCDLDERMRQLVQLWPGPLSIIGTKRPIVPSYITTLPSILLVCPDKFSIELVEAAPFRIACTSANLSGAPAITTFADAFETFRESDVLIIDGGPSRHGANGTIINIQGQVPTVLRLGPYPVEELQTLLPDLVIAETLLRN